MKIWMRAEPAGFLKSRSEGDAFRCSLQVNAWDSAEASVGDPGEIVALVNGTAAGGRAEIRVQYEEADYAAHKNSLVVQRAVKEAMKRIGQELQNHLRA
ncbi:MULTISPECIES: hypothetical protein [Paenibacillus]|uniref:hypothetical protein n=1 Tax=Paenibacillus TaxID=44249 RepID=UPI0022B88A39|nr:hypothetical protein [Paenibacillus caseinilyticus]MCZ8518042.1 hypothetical protein [Paenibacillus caseinilyticus]